jgi:hypothetical protein
MRYYTIEEAADSLAQKYGGTFSTEEIAADSWGFFCGGNAAVFEGDSIIPRRVEALNAEKMADLMEHMRKRFALGIRESLLSAAKSGGLTVRDPATYTPCFPAHVRSYYHVASEHDIDELLNDWGLSYRLSDDASVDSLAEGRLVTEAAPKSKGGRPPEHTVERKAAEEYARFFYNDTSNDPATWYPAKLVCSKEFCKKVFGDEEAPFAGKRRKQVERDYAIRYKVRLRTMADAVSRAWCEANANKAKHETG